MQLLSNDKKIIQVLDIGKLKDLPSKTNLENLQYLNYSVYAFEM